MKTLLVLFFMLILFKIGLGQENKFKILTAISKEFKNGKWSDHWRLEDSLWSNEHVIIDEGKRTIEITIKGKIIHIDINKIVRKDAITEYNGSSLNKKCFIAKELTMTDKNKDAVLYIEFDKVKYYYSVKYDNL